MKKWLIGFMLISLFVACSSGVFAAHWPAPPAKHGPSSNHGPDDRQLNSDAWHIICRTWTALNEVKKVVGQEQYYFDLANEHQQRAGVLYMNGAFHDAIFHSLRARYFAFQIFKKNRIRPRLGFFLDERERRYSKDRLGDYERDDRFDRARIGRDEDHDCHHHN